MFKFSYANWIRSSNRAKNEFNLITLLIFILSCINIHYKILWTSSGFVAIVNLWNPSWLLFGPMLFYAYKVFTGQQLKADLKHALHLLPFLIFLILFAIAYRYTDHSHPFQSPAFRNYQHTYIAIVISLLSYSIYVIRMVWHFDVANKPSSESLMLSIAAIYILISIIMAMIYVVWGILYMGTGTGIDYRLFAYALLFFSAIAIVWYWMFGSDDMAVAPVQLTNNSKSDLKSYRHSALTETLAITYKERITSCFNDTTIYLDSNLSLELLSKDLQIPKHYLSQLFNVHFKKSFHSFVAEYRIKYVLDLLDTNKGRLKIESLAYLCGFNSKTSFNRYFKEKTGFTPSEYQVQLNRQSA